MSSSVNMETLKAELLASHSEFRELSREHKRCEARISELLALQYPSQEELEEEAFLKKKKLGIKDRMEEILQAHKKTASAGH